MPSGYSLIHHGENNVQRAAEQLVQMQIILENLEKGIDLKTATNEGTKFGNSLASSQLTVEVRKVVLNGCCAICNRTGRMFEYGLRADREGPFVNDEHKIHWEGKTYCNKKCYKNKK